MSVSPETLNLSTLGIVIACFELGALVGALACLDVGDRWGRRMTVWVGMTFMLVGGALQTSAWSLGQLTTGRVISGVGLGLQVATVPSWQSECAKPKPRGRWVVSHAAPLLRLVATTDWLLLDDRGWLVDLWRCLRSIRRIRLLLRQGANPVARTGWHPAIPGSDCLRPHQPPP